MKVIKIENCGECPYLRMVRAIIIGADFADQCEMSGEYIEDLDEIEENCPLDDI